MVPADGSCWPARPAATRRATISPTWRRRSATALQRIIKLLEEAGAGPEHIVRLTWYLTSRSEYEAAGAGIGAAWRETLGRNFPPSTLLYIAGLVDARAKVEIEVTAFVASRIGDFSDDTTTIRIRRFRDGLRHRLARETARYHGAFADHAKGVQDFAFNKEQALLIAKTMKETAAQLAEPKKAGALTPGVDRDATV